MSYEPEDANELEFRPAPNAAAARLKAPAILLLVTACINVLFGGYFLFNGFVAMNMPLEQFKKSATMFQPRGEESLKELEKQGFTAEKLQRLTGWVYISWGIIALVASIVSIAGGACMLAGKAYGLAVTAGVLVTIPCLTSPCCLLGLPFGIWSLVVLLNPEVKAGFGR